VLVICGSYMPQTVRQLAALADRYPASVVTVKPELLAAGEIETLATFATHLGELLDGCGIAVLGVDGLPAFGGTDLEMGLRIARGLSMILRAVDRREALVVLKGGVTSAIALRTGLGAREADILGPVLPGVALWRISDAEAVPCLVVPGNVGSDHLLVDIVDRARGGPK
jgi:uncharacterized protein YgbK (DUF1537 family)